jgi:Uma2 family endonuclease
LKQEDLLHPQEGDFIVHNALHDRDCHYLKDALLLSVADDPTAVVNHDVRTDWGVSGIEPHGPDLAVSRGVAPDWDRGQGTFRVAEWGARPVLVIEVTSPSTWAQDFNEKVIEYHAAGVPLYAIVDHCLDPSPGRVQVLLHRATPEGYVRVSPDERGWLWLGPVRLWLAGEGTDAVCYNEQGQRIPDFVEVNQARRQADARAEEAVRARQEAEARAAEEARARQEAEARAAEEARAGQELAARLQQVEAELRRARGKG